MKLKKLKCLLASTIFTVSMSVTTPANAIFGMGDVVFDPSQATNMIQEFAYWAQQLQQMKAQLDQAKSTYDSMTGKRGYGNLMNIPYQMRNYLPEDYQQIMGMLTNQQPIYSRLTDSIRNYMEENQLMTDAEVNKMGLNRDERRIFTEARENVAAIQAMADEALKNASVRFNLLQRLASEINSTSDPKAIEELQARIQVEQNMMTNEQTKLQELFQVMETRKQTFRMQAQELALQQTGRVSELQQPDLSNIQFGK